MTTTREAALEAALKLAIANWSDFTDNAAAAPPWLATARAALAPEPQGYVDGLAKIDGQVFTAAKDMGSRGRENPEWAFIDYEANRMSFGRWAKCGDNPAPYIRADLVLEALAASHAPQPAAWAWDADGFLQPAADTRVGFAPHKDWMPIHRDVLKRLGDIANIRDGLGKLSPDMCERIGMTKDEAKAVEAVWSLCANADYYITPAPSDKIAEAARVPEIAAVIRAAKAIKMGREIFNDRWSEGQPSQPINGPIWDNLSAALRALAGQGETP